MSVITFASSKGGAGRTTSAIALASGLVPGNRVVLIDADPARRLTAWAGRKKLPPYLQAWTSGGESMIRGEIDRARSRAAFVILDLEAAATELNALAMAQSDLVLVPMGDDRQDAEAAVETLARLMRLGRALGRDIPVRILFTRTRKAKSPLQKSLNDRMRARVGCLAWELPDAPAYSALHGQGGPLWSLDREVPERAHATARARLVAEEVEGILKSLRLRDLPTGAKEAAHAV